MSIPDRDPAGDEPSIGGELVTTVALLILLMLAVLFIATLIGALHVFG
jgi:hypothetical protein